METDSQEKLIYRYLLGDLPEPEQFALEQAFFADGEKFERVWAIENELVDRYLRSRLTPAQKVLFEKNYLASPVHRQRLAVAKPLIHAADTAAQRGQANLRTGGSRWTSFFTPFSRLLKNQSIATKPRGHQGAQSPQHSAFTDLVQLRVFVSWWRTPLFQQPVRGNLVQWGMAVTALILVAGVVGLFMERARLSKQVSQLNNQRASEQQHEKELEKLLAEQRERSDQLAADLERSRNEQSNSLGQRTLQTPPDRVGQVERHSLVSLLLSPLLMRSGGEPQQLKLSTETTDVRLQMKVQDPGSRDFQVSLRTVEGAQIWGRTAIRAGALAKDRSLISVRVPANKLSTGEYILTLSASSGANEPEEINRYFFRVIKQ